MVLFWYCFFLSVPFSCRGCHEHYVILTFPKLVWTFVPYSTLCRAVLKRHGKRQIVNWILIFINALTFIRINENAWALTYLPRSPHAQSFCPTVLLAWWTQTHTHTHNKHIRLIIGQTVWLWEWSQTHRHTDTHTHGSDSITLTADTGGKNKKMWYTFQNRNLPTQMADSITKRPKTFIWTSAF